jgi:hypothetical protein
MKIALQMSAKNTLARVIPRKQLMILNLKRAKLSQNNNALTKLV